jgi:hypothetical protein
MFYLSTKAVIYILNKRDVEGFAESILERSVLLMEQIEFVESKSKSVNESAACTKEHIKSCVKFSGLNVLLKTLLMLRKVRISGEILLG